MDILKLFLEAREDTNPVIHVNPADFHSNPSGLLSFNKSETVLWTIAKIYKYIYKFNGDESVLVIAAALGHLNIIVYYKDVLQFSNINPKNNNGITPLNLSALYWASFNGNIDVVEYYIENGYKASSKVSFLLFNPELTYPYIY